MSRFFNNERVKSIPVGVGVVFKHARSINYEFGVFVCYVLVIDGNGSAIIRN